MMATYDQFKTDLPTVASNAHELNLREDGGQIRTAERLGVKCFYVEDESDQAHDQIVKDLHYLKTVRI